MNGGNQNQTPQPNPYTSVDTGWGAVLRNAAPQMLLKGTLWGGAILAALLVCGIAWNVITDLSGYGSNIGFNITNWFRDASINPSNKKGFTNFLKLILTLGGIGILLKFLKR